MNIQIGDRVKIAVQTDFKFTLSILEPPPELQGQLNEALIGKEGTVIDIWKHRIYPDFYKYVIDLDGDPNEDNRVMMPIWWIEKVVQ